MKKIYFVGLMCVMLVMSGCKKRYVSPLETPTMTKAAEDKAYDFDYVQLNNDVIESLQNAEIYSFVKDLSVDGDNDKKVIVLDIEIDENVSDDAVELLLTDATKAIVDAAHTQDFRVDEWNEDGFGNLFDKFGYKYTVKCDSEIVREENLNAGDSVPFDINLTLEQVVG